MSVYYTGKSTVIGSRMKEKVQIIVTQAYDCATVQWKESKCPKLQCTRLLYCSGWEVSSTIFQCCEWTKYLFWIYIHISGCKEAFTRVHLCKVKQSCNFENKKEQNWKMLGLIINLLYAGHYNPRFVYFKPTFWGAKTFFQEGFSQNSALMYG